MINKKLRIIHIVHGKANPNGHNGISRVVYNLNKQEKLKGHDSEIWAIVDDAKHHYTHVRDEYVTVECFPRVRNPFGKHEIIQELIKHKNSIDLVHFHLIWNIDKNIIAKSLKKEDIKFIITTHGTYSKKQAYTGKRLIARLLYEKSFLNMADEIHIITRQEGMGLLSYGYSGKSFVSYNGIDPDEIPNVRSKKYYIDKSYSNKIIIAWIGVLRDDKNILSMIRSVTLLDSKIRNRIVFVLIGPDYKKNVNKYMLEAEKYGCRNNIEYLGPLYGQEKYDAIESADAFIMPSYSEAFSLATLDALACSKPCIISSGCGFNYHYRDNFFVLCEPYAQDIARAVEELYELKNEWSEMGANARKVVEKYFTWSRIADTMISNYKRIVM